MVYSYQQDSREILARGQGLAEMGFGSGLLDRAEIGQTLGSPDPG